MSPISALAAPPCIPETVSEGGRICLPRAPFSTAPAVPDREQQAPQGPVVTPPEELPLPDVAQQGFAGLPWWGIALVAALILLVLLLAYTLLRHQRPTVGVASPVPDAPADDGPLGVGREAGAYEELVRGLIGAYDLSDSPAVRAHVEKSLRGVGIRPIMPIPGDPFDVGLHNGVSGVSAPTADHAWHIAKTLRPGWRTADVVVRPADVEVFRG